MATGVNYFDSAANSAPLRCSPIAQAVCDRLERDGVAVLHGYLPKAQTTRIRQDLGEIVRAHAGEVVLNYKYLTTKRIRQEWIPEESALSNYVFDPFFMEVAYRYLKDDHRFPTKHYVTYSGPGTDPKVLPYRLHFDDMRFLKFFVYLTDVRRENGPIWVMPGTHHENRQWREEQIIKGKSFDQMDVTPKGYSDPKRLDGPRGTVIIFDTNITHRAGLVYHGEYREAFQTLVATEKDLAWRNYGDPHP